MSKNGTPKRRHVVPNPEGGWDVKAPGAKRSSGHYDTQKEAESRAKEILRNIGGGEATRDYQDLYRRPAHPELY